jgi:hypothetical protein
MRLIPIITFSGLVAFGAAGGMARDMASQPPGQAQAAPEGYPRGGPPGGPQGAPGGPRAPLAMGGTVGTVDSVSASSFALSTSTGRKVTVETTSATTYRQGKEATSARAVATGASVLVLGMADVGMGGTATTIKASQVIVRPAAGGADGGGPATSTAFQQGTPSAARAVGQIPADYTEGSGTIVGGTEANKAIEAALGAYTGGIVNRVVKLNSGGYEVHNVGVRWPHHIFVNRDFTYVGAN